MKNLFLFFTAISFLSSCQKKSVEKPINLIPKETMVNVIYDLSVLQAMKNSNHAILDSNRIEPTTYIYKKYKIDSVQFAKSNEFYASNIKEYERMYESVNNRLLENKKLSDTLVKKEEKRLEKKLEKEALEKRKKADTIKKVKKQQSKFS